MKQLEDKIIKNFQKDSSFIKYEINEKNKVKAKIFYIEGLVDLNKIGEIVIKKIENDEDIYLFPNVKELTNSEDIIYSIVTGNVIVFDYKNNKISAIELRQLFLRAVNEPDNEKLVKGPREGLIENIIVNVSLIRNKIKRKDFKVEYSNLKSEGDYRIGLLYLNDTVDKKALRLLKQRIKRINTLKGIDSNFLKEQIKDYKYCPFNTIGDTSRPDICAFKLLEGKIVILVDGTPNALYLPFLLSENFQTVDDYYTNFYYSSVSRLFRFISFIITIIFPGLYVSRIDTS